MINPNMNPRGDLETVGINLGCVGNARALQVSENCGEMARNGVVMK